MKISSALLVVCFAKINCETIVHHGIVGHFENIGPCASSLISPQCEQGGTYCADIGMCTKPGGKCRGNGKKQHCVDVRWNRDVCVKPANTCNGGFCGKSSGLLLILPSSSDCQSSLMTNAFLFVGSPPNFEDCRCDIHGDGGCYKVEFTPHHDHGLWTVGQTRIRCGNDGVK
jgi:hypothetical protein